jgi:RNA polymerase sigma factor (sigma-70 family)
LSFRQEAGSKTEWGRASARTGDGEPSEGSRKRAAIEIVARHEIALRQTARRYSLCDADAEDAYQRGLEILLTKAPSDDLRELIRWTQTVVKHEALAVRRNRERLLGNPAPSSPGGAETDWVALIQAPGSDPAERVEKREAIARSREALQSLKPQELRALTLLAEGYSYAEISQITGYSGTKVNRCLAEGRERFRRIVASSADGERCSQLRPLLSAFCDGEASEADGVILREHLRACGGCRATMRAYRAAPPAAAALASALPASRSLFERGHEALAGLHSRLPGRGGGTADAALSQVTAVGGSRGAGMAALAKVLALCIGTAGGAAACVATGVVAVPGINSDRAQRPTLERPSSARQIDAPGPEETGPTYEPAPVEAEPPPSKAPTPKPEPAKAVESTPAPTASAAGAVEYTPPPPPAPPPTTPATRSSGSAAGEFGP